MSEFDFDALSEEVMVATFAEAWGIDNSETDGIRSYKVNETRLMFEAFTDWKTVARASTMGYETATGEKINQ